MEDCRWSELPGDILRIITKKLSSSNDLVGFSGVCSHWRSVVSSSFPSILLAVPEQPVFTLDHNSKSIFNLFHFNHLIRCVENKQGQDYYCVGSSKGMLILLDRRTSSKPLLLNPFTRQTHHFPSLRKIMVNKKRKRTVFEDDDSDSDDDDDDSTWIYKAIVLEQHKSLVLVVIYGHLKRLAYCYLYDCSWIALSDDSFFDVVSSEQDGNKVYALTFSGSVESWDFSRLRKRSCVFAHRPGGRLPIPPRYLKCCQKQYLAVGPGNEFYVVRRIIRKEFIIGDRLYPYKTLAFIVYKPNRALSTWEYDDDSFSAAVFVGASETKVVSPSEFPVRGCVYFTDDNWFKIIHRGLHRSYSTDMEHINGHDIGVYSLTQNKLVVGLYQFLDDLNLNLTPFWFMPNNP